MPDKKMHLSKLDKAALLAMLDGGVLSEIYTNDWRVLGSPSRKTTPVWWKTKRRLVKALLVEPAPEENVTGGWMWVKRFVISEAGRTAVATKRGLA